MSEKKLLLYTVAGIILVSIIGSLLHFAYDFSGENYFVGLITPVNESIGEHMKLVFFPALAYFFFESSKLEESYPNFSCAASLGLLIGTFSIPVLFYTYSGIIGQNFLVADILIFIISTILTFLVSYYFAPKECTDLRRKLVSALVVIVFFSFLIFTYFPPQIGLFLEP